MQKKKPATRIDPKIIIVRSVIRQIVEDKDESILPVIMLALFLSALPVNFWWTYVL
jgi:hypothetical protein